MKRRKFLNTAALSAATLAAFPLHGKEIDPSYKTTPLKNNINHAVCHWCYSDIALEDFLIAVKKNRDYRGRSYGPQGMAAA